MVVKKYLLILIFFSLSIFQTYGQVNIDSLENLLTDSNYYDYDETLFLIVKYYENNNLEKVLNYSKQRIKHYKQTNNIQKLKRAYYVGANIYSKIGLYSFALKNYYKILELKIENDLTHVSWTYIGIGNLYYAQNNLNEAISSY